jgi:uncharacterized protein with GYD domain
MPAYVMLIQYTEQGVKNIKQAPARIDAARQAFKAAGAEMKQLFLVMGHYDLVVIGEAPNDETIARLSLSLGSLGNIRTETLRAFTEEEFRKMIPILP